MHSRRTGSEFFSEGSAEGLISWIVRTGRTICWVFCTGIITVIVVPFFRECHLMSCLVGLGVDDLSLPRRGASFDNWKMGTGGA